MAMTACQTGAPSYPTTTIETEDLMTVKSVRVAFRPIFPSRADVMTEGTARQIEDHNNAYWCLFADARPPGFDKSVCRRPVSDRWQ